MERLVLSFLLSLCLASGSLMTDHLCGSKVEDYRPDRYLSPDASPESDGSLVLFLCGDVMTGRGIDQVLPHPCDPRIYEPYMRSALGYVELAELAYGPISRPVSYSYVWGDAFEEWQRGCPDVRLINLETSVTKSEDYWKGKGIHYRMHPLNVLCLTAAQIDCCALANNHTLDWGYPGLSETLKTLRKANVKTAGAGRNLKEAQAPAVIEVPNKGRVLVFSFGSVTSGIARSWTASQNRAGVNLLPDLSDRTVQRIEQQVQAVKHRGDVVVASIHWGGNWGYGVSWPMRQFAHGLIDRAGVDIIHGHSSHHVRPVEVYKGKLILYGCGDFLNDYEGIGGYEHFRGDLALMYFVSVDPATGRLARMSMTPMQIRHFRLNRATGKDAQWLKDTLNRECEPFGTRVKVSPGNTLILEWD